MHEQNTIAKIINTFTSTTQIPVMYIEDFKSLPTVSSDNFDLQPVLEYCDFNEITDYLEGLFNQSGEGITGIDIFHTRSCLVYIIAPVNRDLNKYAYIAGPILPYSFEKNITEEVITSKNLPHHKKVKYESLIRTLPIVSEERLGYLGQLLHILSQSQEMHWYTTVQEAGSRNIPDTSFCVPNDNSIDVPEGYENLDLYSFILKIKEKIVQGNMDGIIDLLNTHSSLFWINKANDDCFRSFKNRSLVICAISSVFAIQTNAPYKRIMNLLVNFIENISNMKWPQEIILKTAYTLETYAYLVSISSNSNYSLHIKRVMQYIKGHYKEKITLKKLAEYVNLNSVYLSSLIKKETNLSLLDNINHIRVEEAKNLLILTQKSIQEISYVLGYNYQNHFNNVFKKFTGMTPLEFRQNFGRNSFEL